MSTFLLRGPKQPFYVNVLTRIGLYMSYYKNQLDYVEQNLCTFLRLFVYRFLEIGVTMFPISMESQARMLNYSNSTRILFESIRKFSNNVSIRVLFSSTWKTAIQTNPAE